MLGKLIKYEFKHTSKTMLTTYAVLAAATLMGSLALYRTSRELDIDGTFLSIVNVIMLTLYVIAIIGIYCIDFIYLCCHYHKTMYSSQGYLTHTLPVPPAATFSVKIFVIFIWMFISSLLSVLSVLILLQIGSGGEFFRELTALPWNTLMQEIDDFFGMPGGLLIFIFIVETILSILLYIMWITASMAIGQLFQKSRTGFTILAAVCLYMADQIIGSIFLAANGYSTKLLIEGNAHPFINSVITCSIVTSVIFIVLLYGLCIYINKRKINLE